MAAASPWPRVLLLYAAGLVAAAQLGKLSALAPLLVTDLGLGLTTMAWAISLLELGGASAGAVAGVLAQRWGLVRGLRWGVAALALAGAGQGLASGAAGLIAWRLLEALGYLAVIVTAPVLLVRQTAAAGVRTQGLALTLWSTFVPVGLACGAAAAATVAQHSHWRWATAAGAGVAAALALWLWRVPLRDEPALPGAAGTDSTDRAARTDRASHPLDTERQPDLADQVHLADKGSQGNTAEQAHGAAKASRAVAADALAVGRASASASASTSTSTSTDAPPRASTAAWALAAGFGLYALFAIGMLALLPLLLVQQAGLSPAAAGLWTGLVSASGLAGSALAAEVVRRGAAPRGPLLLGLAVPGLLLPWVFTPGPVLGWSIALSVAIHVLGGLYASLAFAQMPRVAGSHAGLVRANGLLAQFGASGSLLGPPTMAACVQWGGWPAAAMLGLVVSALALPLTWRATQRPTHTSQA